MLTRLLIWNVVARGRGADVNNPTDGYYFECESRQSELSDVDRKRLRVLDE